MLIKASEILNLSNESLISVNASLKRDSNHSIARFEDSGCSISFTSQLLTKRNAFHTLFVKLRPCSHCELSNGKSFPAGDEIKIPIRTPSAPYWFIKSIGSGELPNDLDILRPNLSRTIPV